MKEKVAENDKAMFYKNSMCEDFRDGFKIILAEQKENGYQEYLLLKNDKLVYNSQKIEQVWFKREVLKRLELENEIKSK